MNVIENFAELSKPERRAFAEALIKTINSESTFSDQVDFQIDDVYADDLTGNLVIETSTVNNLEVERKATWSAPNSEAAEEIPDSEYIEYDYPLYSDMEDALTTLSAEVEGYTVSAEVYDPDQAEITRMHVEDYTQEDDGIGWNEFWGHVSYDSRPYVSVTGIVYADCGCGVQFTVEPTGASEPAIEPEEEI